MRNVALNILWKEVGITSIAIEPELKSLIPWSEPTLGHKVKFEGAMCSEVIILNELLS